MRIQGQTQRKILESFFCFVPWKWHVHQQPVGESLGQTAWLLDVTSDAIDIFVVRYVRLCSYNCPFPFYSLNVQLTVCACVVFVSLFVSCFEQLLPICNNRIN